MKKIYNHYPLDTHTEVLSEGLNNKEKDELGISSNLYVHINEIGFIEPKNDNSWEKDCFNVLIYTEEDIDFEEAEVKLFDIEKLPLRFKETYEKIKKDRDLISD
jgi:hypothetical protein